MALSAVVELFEQYRADGELIHLVIADGTHDAYLGEVMVVMCEHRVAELGIGLAARTRGRGIATEAFRTFVVWCATALDIGRLQVLVAPENVSAMRLAERSGFRREGLLRSYWEHDGIRLDAVMLSLIPAELQ